MAKTFASAARSRPHHKRFEAQTATEETAPTIKNATQTTTNMKTSSVTALDMASEGKFNSRRTIEEGTIFNELPEEKQFALREVKLRGSKECDKGPRVRTTRKDGYKSVVGRGYKQSVTQELQFANQYMMKRRKTMNGTVGMASRRLPGVENRDKHSTPINAIHADITPDAVKGIKPSSFKDSNNFPLADLRRTPGKNYIF